MSAEVGKIQSTLEQALSRDEVTQLNATLRRGSPRPGWADGHERADHADRGRPVTRRAVRAADGRVAAVMLFLV